MKLHLGYQVCLILHTYTWERKSHRSAIFLKLSKSNCYSVCSKRFLKEICLKISHTNLSLPLYHCQSCSKNNKQAFKCLGFSHTEIRVWKSSLCRAFPSSCCTLHSLSAASRGRSTNAAALSSIFCLQQDFSGGYQGEMKVGENAALLVLSSKCWANSELHIIVISESKVSMYGRISRKTILRFFFFKAIKK